MSSPSDQNGPGLLLRLAAVFLFCTLAACVLGGPLFGSTMSATTTTTDTAAQEPPKKKRREAPSKPRAPARPYRRLEAGVLDSRMKDLVKKMSVLKSKLVLLEDRLEGHANENNLRLKEV